MPRVAHHDNCRTRSVLRRVGARTWIVTVVLQLSWCVAGLAQQTQQAQQGPPASSPPPTAEDIFRSVSDSMEQKTDPAKAMAAAAVAAGVLMLLALLALRRQRHVAPKAVNHPGRLLKEVGKALHLKPAEVKQLKVLADSQGVSSPLALLLCPSLLAKAAKEHPSKLDRSTIAGLAKKVVGDRAS